MRKLKPSNENMKKLILLSTFFFSINVHALPDCPSNTSLVAWNNCFGTYTFINGDKYVGGFKDGKFHGRGTMTFADGRKEVGLYMKGEYIPDICENMMRRQIIKSVESFRNCILKLIDDL